MQIFSKFIKKTYQSTNDIFKEKSSLTSLVRQHVSVIVDDCSQGTESLELTSLKCYSLLGFGAYLKAEFSL